MAAAASRFRTTGFYRYMYIYIHIYKYIAAVGECQNDLNDGFFKECLIKCFDNQSFARPSDASLDYYSQHQENGLCLQPWLFFLLPSLLHCWKTDNRWQ